MSLLKDYEDFEKFFAENKLHAEKKFKVLGEEFKKYFDTVISAVLKVSPRSHNRAISLAVIGRAIKYLFTAYTLCISGHLEESRILLRNVVELLLLAFLLANSVDTYEKWKICFQLRKINTKNGNVDIQEITNKKFEINTIIKENADIIEKYPAALSLKRLRGELSTYSSHENIYNIVARVEDLESEGKIEIYTGQSASSENSRTEKTIKTIIDLAKDACALVE